MRLALASDRHRGPLQPRNGNRIWLVTCIATVLVAVVVVLKVTGSSCPADPRADGVAAVGGASPGPSHPDAGRTTARHGPGRSRGRVHGLRGGLGRPEPGGLRPDRRPQGRPGRGELPDRPGPAAARAAGAPDLRRGAAWHPGRPGHQPRQPALVGSGQPAGEPVAAARAELPRPGAPAGRAAGTRIRICVTDVAGHQVVLTGVSGRSTVLHATTWMYRGRGLAGSQSGLSPAPAARAGRHAGPAGPAASC